MTFQDAVTTCFRKYARFSGRASRSEYWWFYLFVVAGSFLLSLVDATIFGATEESPSPISSLFSFVILIPSFAVAARRLHDTNHSGWWQVVPASLGIAAATMAVMEATILSGAALVSALATLILLLVWLIREGDVGLNRFGPDPLDDSEPRRDDTNYASSAIPRVPRDKRR